MPRKKEEEIAETPAAADGSEAVGANATETIEAAATPVESAPKKEAEEPKAEAASGGTESAKTSKRAERVGIVSSDKMTKTVVVRVDRLVKHPVYRKYVKKRKKFMAHDELGAKIGDKVKIQETRPMSARKRWRVVEIIQKAEV
ncbi:MAG: 30S ribosomal protein S17 [Acidobacteriota bacterium]